MIVWQTTKKCILHYLMRSLTHWNRSNSKISAAPRTFLSPPNKKPKKSISQQRTKKAAVPRAASAAMPQFPSQSFLRISTISPAAASAAMPPPPPQSAARLPSLAPHEVGRGCNMNRHAEDSWRSHVHRTYTAQRVQSFKPQTANANFLWVGLREGYLFLKRDTPPLPVQRRWRCHPSP